MDRRNKKETMVQVASAPTDENEPILPTSSGSQNVPDDLKETRLNSITNEAYRILSGAMMADEINQTDPIIVLKLLESSLTNRNVPLAKHHMSNLNHFIDKENALKILRSISRWIHSSEADQPLNFEPSAPPLADNNLERNDNWMKEPLGQVRGNILLEIDKDGDFFLKQKEFQDLQYQDVLDITTRDSLNVSSEMVIYGAIMRWAVAECERKALATEDANIKAVLKDLIYAPRYGLMTKKEFRTRTIAGHRGPDRIGIRTDINEKIVKYITDKEKKKKLLEELPYKMSKERKAVMQQNKTELMKEKVIINCLTCFSAVFD